jgi:hypothetical protein
LAKPAFAEDRRLLEQWLTDKKGRLVVSMAHVRELGHTVSDLTIPSKIALLAQDVSAAYANLPYVRVWSA